MERSAIAEPPAGSEAAGVVHSLADRHETLATVESLTGGSLAAAVVEIAGSSRVFRGGLVVYATELKERLAGVPGDLLAERGPVDPDVAVALAEGGRRRCGADWGLATTGVAGPEPQGGKPVGLVYVASAGPAGTTVRELHLDGNRAAIRAASVSEALRLLTDQLQAPLEAADRRGVTDRACPPRRGCPGFALSEAGCRASLQRVRLRIRLRARCPGSCRPGEVPWSCYAM